MTWAWLILAQDAPLTRRQALELLRKGFHKELASNDLFIYVIGAVALIALILLLSQVIRQRQRPKPPPRRDYLLEAVKVLGLTRQERSDLLELAARARLPQPAAMLLSPANLSYALSRAAIDAPAGPLRNRLDALSRKLFGEGLTRNTGYSTFQTASRTASGNQPV
ncbi:MAG: hypothetical protein GX547_15250 [Phycisphaerae bacterium]|nr:hypothetical protein [Phycisphaerae bacterium]